MNEDMTGLLFVAILATVLWGSWYFLPIVYGLPWVPSDLGRIRRALELAQVRQDEMVFDLGAGDGRVLLIAGAEFGAKAVGVEIEPLHCLLAWWRIQRAGLAGRVRVRWGDFFKVDFAEADVVIAYLTSAQARRIQAPLAIQLQSGARVVAISADIPAWQPDLVDLERLIFVYHMPPTPGDLGTYLAQQAQA